MNYNVYILTKMCMCSLKRREGGRRRGSKWRSNHPPKKGKVVDNFF